MKIKNLLRLGLIVLTSLSLSISEGHAQIIQQTPVGGQQNGLNNYRVQGLNPSQPGALFSYLWWFGENGFRFNVSPNYTHNYVNAPNPLDLVALVTENYGTAGPPPLAFTVNSTTRSNNPQRILPVNNTIYMQHYRNAVADDTMYSIITYSNLSPDGGIANGTLEIELSQNAQVLHSFIQQFPKVLPNGERQVQNQNKWSFTQLKHGEERSILIPIKIAPNATDSVNIKVIMKTTEREEPLVQGINTYDIDVPLVKAHDPNLMIEDSEAQNICTYGGRPIDYTVKFQNTGEGPTRYIKVTCQLDDKVDLSTIRNVKFPDIYASNQITQGGLLGLDNGNNQAIWDIDNTSKTLTFEMHDIVLVGTNDPNCVDLETTRDQVSFTIDVKSNYTFGAPTKAYSSIIFDKNAAIETAPVYTVCGDPLSDANGGGFATVTPTPSDPTWWYWGGAGALILAGVAFGASKMRKKG